MDFYISYADWGLLNSRIQQFSNEKAAASATPQSTPFDDEDSEFDDEEWGDEEEQDHFGDGVFFDGPSDWYASSSAYAGVAQVLNAMKDKFEGEIKEAAEMSVLTLISANGLCNIFDFPTAPDESMGLDHWFMALCPERVVQLNEDFQRFRIEDYETVFDSLCGESSTTKIEFSNIVDYVNMWKSAIEKGAQNNWAIKGTWG